MTLVYARCLATLLALSPLAVPAEAAPMPYCFVLNWRDGDSCSFSAPAGSFAFGGTAADPLNAGQYGYVEVAVQFRLAGTSQPLGSCYARATPDRVAECADTHDGGPVDLPIDGVVTYVCQAFGTGGPKFQCADPPHLGLVPVTP